MKENKKVSLSVCLTLLLAVLCSLNLSKPVLAQSMVSTSNAIVYVYRYKQFVGYTVEPSVYCNDEQLARMDNGRYFKVVLSPGTYTFRSNDKQSGLEMELKSGEEYYLRVEIVQGLMKQYGRLVLMTKEQGSYEIKKLKPLGASKIKDRKRVIVDEQSSKDQN